MNEAQIISIIRQEAGIGKSITRQRVFYTPEEKRLITEIISYLTELWVLINWTFRKSTQNETLLRKLIVGFLNKEISFVSVFCPSYKTGIGSYGYNSKIGSSTKKNIDYLEKINDKFNLFNIKSDFFIYFSDLLLENYKCLNSVPYHEQLESNFNDLVNRCPDYFYVDKLSSLGSLDSEIGEIGPNKKIVDIDNNDFKIVLDRNKKFYINVLGWGEIDVEARTFDLAIAYPYIAEQMNIKYPESVLYWSESAIERIYLMPNLKIPILIPSGEK